MAAAQKPRAAATARTKAASAPVADGRQSGQQQKDAAPPAPAVQPVEQPMAELSAADRENPSKLSGEALRRLAHQRGIARSESERMSDEKLRMQLRYINGRQYAEAD